MNKHRILISAIMVFLIPAILFSRMEMPVNEEDTTAQTEMASESSTRISVWTGTEAEQMDLEVYIASVLYGEMPAEFEMEALKAQAVAIRTYTLRRAAGSGKHEQADVCTDPGCCQAFAYVDGSYRADRVLQAVKQTKGQVLTYAGDLIEATYFSCSGGRTESAVEVWGADVPYLQAKDSPGEEDAAHYQDTVILTEDAFAQKLGLQYVSNVSDITYTSGGGVKSIKINGVVFGGTQLRQLLGLPSTVFTITNLGDSIVINTKGYGHRVGMSQYGAEAMAVNGHTYDEILAYYYPGTELYILTTEDIQQIFDKEGNL